MILRFPSRGTRLKVLLLAETGNQNNDQHQTEHLPFVFPCTEQD